MGTRLLVGFFALREVYRVITAIAFSRVGSIRGQYFHHTFHPESRAGLDRESVTLYKSAVNAPLIAKLERKGT